MKQQLRFVHDHFGRWFTHLALCAYFFDLRCLFFELRGHMDSFEVAKTFSCFS